MTGLVPLPLAPTVISPSVVTAFQECPARAGFRSDVRVAGLRRTGPKAALGNVAHEVLSVAQGPDSFDSVWDAAADRWFERLKKDWAPAVPPRPAQWPGWALTRARVRLQYEAIPSSDSFAVAVADDIRSARRDWDTASSAPTANHLASVAPPGPLPWIERKLVDIEQGLLGIPDLVVEIDGALVVVDYKTGLAHSGVTAADELQLRLYAALVESTSGQLPDHAEVRDASGAATVVETGRKSVDDALRLAASALGSLLGAAVGELELIGKPTASRCAPCSFRGVCRAYLESEPSTRPLGRAFVFAVTGVDTKGPSSGIDARVTAPPELEGEFRLTGFPFPGAVEVGSLWGAANFELLPGHARGHWTTLLHSLT